jgi:hypothetical protein
MATRYYAEEITAVPFRTLKRCLSGLMPGPLAFAMAAFLRMRGRLNWPLKPMAAVGEIGSEKEVAREALPPEAISRWAPIVEQLGDLGFSPIRYWIADTIGEKQQVIALFLDSIGGTIATLEWNRMRGAEGIEEKTPLEFNSYADEDPEFMTGAITNEDLALADMLSLDFVDPLLLPNHLPLKEVYHRHLSRTDGKPIYLMGPEAALLEHRKRSERRFEWAMQQGLVRCLTSDEVSRVSERRLD